MTHPMTHPMTHRVPRVERAVQAWMLTFGARGTHGDHLAYDAGRNGFREEIED